MPDKLGPYELDHVYQGDCVELMKELPAGSVPMIWTDPPYGVDYNDGDMNSSLDQIFSGRKRRHIEKPVETVANDGEADAMAITRKMLVEAGRVLDKECCVCCCCCGGGGPKPLFAKVALMMDEPPLEFFHAVVWDKMGLGLGLRYRRNYEFVMIAKRRTGKLLWARVRGDKKTANVVRVPKVIPKAKEHPTPKPVELIKHFLELHTKPGELVLDPFCGSSPVGVACVSMGRRFLGFELEPHWVRVANDRIQAAKLGCSLEDVEQGQDTLFGETESEVPCGPVTPARGDAGTSSLSGDKE